MKSELLNRAGGAAQCLSALRDGETTADLTQALCATWASEQSLADDWHAWSLIGDVLRSDDLAVAPQADEEFLLALRQRLAREPVILAPARQLDRTEVPPPSLPDGLAVLTQPRAFRARRLANAALAVGTLAVAGVLVLGRLEPAVQAGSPQLALAAPAGEAEQASPAVVLRNPDLDRYLNAHRQFVQGPALAAPGGVRQVALTPDGR
jgi:sigma-E factor negative regulatory protein RseA